MKSDLRARVIQLVHHSDTAEVQAAAIALFYYWVYRLNGKIQKGQTL